MIPETQIRGALRALIKAGWISAGFFLTGCVTPVAQEPFDPFNLEIQAGRWGVMNSQGEEILQNTPSSSGLALEESDAARRARLAQRLRLAVLDFDRLKADACFEGKLSRLACVARARPAWTKAPERAPPNWKTLQARSDAVGAEIMPIWDEVCTAAKTKAGAQSDESEPVCPME